MADQMFYVCESQNPQNAAPRAMDESLAEINIYGPPDQSPADYFSSLKDARAFARELRVRLGEDPQPGDGSIFIMKVMEG